MGRILKIAKIPQDKETKQYSLNLWLLPITGLKLGTGTLKYRELFLIHVIFFYYVQCFLKRNKIKFGYSNIKSFNTQLKYIENKTEVFLYNKARFEPRTLKRND